MSEILFWISAVGLVHVYLGYPALVWVLAWLIPRPVRKAPWPGQCSVVVVAHNEAARLPGKIESITASAAAGQIAEIIVASDGSDDDTAAVIREIADPRVRLVEFAERRGKAAVLNDVLPQCRSDVIVLTDARQDIAPEAFAGLLSNFSDEQVGVVSGELVFHGGDRTSVSEGIGFYWRYEKFIRRNESRFGSVPGATGALYAIRKKLFRPIPTDSLLDDVAIPMQAVMQGSRCVFEEQAVVFDRPSNSVMEENIRKRRTIAGNVQLIRLFPGWLLPWRNPIWFQYVSHKLGRLLSPFFLAGVFGSSLTLFRDPLYAGALAAQVLLYGMAMIGWLSSVRWCGVATVFVSLNLTTVCALADAVSSRFNVRWERGPFDGDR